MVLKELQLARAVSLVSAIPLPGWSWLQMVEVRT